MGTICECMVKKIFSIKTCSHNAIATAIFIAYIIGCMEFSASVHWCDCGTKYHTDLVRNK